MKLSDFDYALPAKYIAQTPIEPRHASRLLVLRRGSRMLEEGTFWDIQQYLDPGDILVVNQTRVIPARLIGHKLPGGGLVEILLLKQEDELTWEVLVGGRGLRSGRKIEFSASLNAEISAEMDGARRKVRFSQPVASFLPQLGQTPLPPYIHQPLADPERYQTVFARQPGSSAAPTAGLHFSPELLTGLVAGGVQLVQVTLHVGLDTFAPVTESDPNAHQIHSEWCELTSVAAEKINLARRAGKRVIAVGTTSVRTLETAAYASQVPGEVAPFSGQTNLFILPGYTFRVVDGLVTNFHLPRSTLIMLVSAFAGREQVLHAYEVAKERNFRFYSFGDAMLIL